LHLPVPLQSRCVVFLQIIQVLKTCFDLIHTELLLFPYKVIPLRVGKEKAPGGIIECVPNVKSRDEVGKLGFPTLFDYFLNTFGRSESRSFEDARRNMIRSLAAYAVVCYILQIKDRHNGNLLVTEGGHLVHIDFGFLLGISPGGNLGFETASFKLTQVRGPRCNAVLFCFTLGFLPGND
jgi:phosphatidylinositol 4-kinase A